MEKNRTTKEASQEEAVTEARNTFLQMGEPTLHSTFPGRF